MTKKKKCKSCGHRYRTFSELYDKLVAFDEQAARQVARIIELKEQIKIQNSS